MKYRLRLNGDPTMETNVEHVEKTGENCVTIDDIGTFPSPKEVLMVSKFELFGEDGELYAMRKVPKHFPIMFTSNMTLTVQLRLTIDNRCLGKS